MFVHVLCVNHWTHTGDGWHNCRSTGRMINDTDVYNSLNTLRPRQNGHHFAEDIFKWIFLNENVWILINNIPALVQIMAWRRPGNKPLSEPMAVSLLRHVCVTQSQWVKPSSVGHVNIWHTSTVNIVCNIYALMVNVDMSLYIFVITIKDFQ